MFMKFVYFKVFQVKLICVQISDETSLKIVLLYI